MRTQLSDFYSLYVGTRKHLGLPPQPYGFIRSLWKTFAPSGAVEILAAELDGRQVAGILLLKYRERVSVEYSVHDERYRDLSPVHFLFWEAMKMSRAGGYRIFDLGRTAASNKSLMDFKRRWGTQVVDLPEFHFSVDRMNDGRPRADRAGYGIVRKVCRLHACRITADHRENLLPAPRMMRKTMDAMTKDSRGDCQLRGVPGMAAPVDRVNILWQLRNRVRRMAKRRWAYLKNLSTAWSAPRSDAAVTAAHSTAADRLRPGDLVRIRSKSEIRSTLSNWNDLKGCAMMEEMWDYCDTRHRVFKRVERFLDERDYLVKQTSGIVLLEGVICNGTVDFGPCDRACSFFWREEWLEKITGDGGENP